MAADPRRAALKEAIAPIARCLGSGWEQGGFIYRHDARGEVTHLVEFQLNKYTDQWNVAVNLGVYSSVAAGLLDWPAPSAPTSGACQLRARLTELESDERKDSWTQLPVNEPMDSWSRVLCTRLQTTALKELDRLDSPLDIITAWESDPQAPWFRGVSALVRGAFCVQAHRFDLAVMIAENEVRQLEGSTGHKWAERVFENIKRATR
jgi:hypothetical protein